MFAIRNCAMSRTACFEWRPVFRLIGRQLETCLEGCDTRVGERGDIRSARTMTMFETLTAVTETAVTAEPLLRIDVRRAGDSKQRRRGNNWFEHVILLGTEPFAFPN